LNKLFPKFEEYFIAFLLAAMTVVNVVNVFVRYVLQSNIHWAMEFTTIAFAWLIFLGAAWGIKVGAHIGVDTLINFLSDKIKKQVSTIAAVLCIIYGIFILVGSYNYVLKIYSVGILSQDIKWLPQWMPRVVMPLGYALIILRFTEALIKIVTGKQTTLGLANEAKDAIDSFKVKRKRK
jgi:C4-dicarboxylate transporter DctQ subunit